MIKLYIPKLEELNYRQHLLSDEVTMSYNKGYDLGISYYNKATGCLGFTKEYHQEWYSRWINVDNRFYAYILDDINHQFVGEVSFRYDALLQGYMVGIIVEGKYRGKGYSSEALRLLCEKAFTEYNAKILYDDIPSGRESAVKLFKKLGFIIDKVYCQNKFDEKEEIYLMKLSKN